MTPVERARRDPVWFCDHVLGTRLWPKQRAIVRDACTKRKTAVKSCHAAGKTFLAANTALAFLYTHRDSIVISTATTHRQVKHLLWKEVHRLHRDSRYPLGGRLTETGLTVEADWLALGFTSKESDATKFQGFHAEHILVIVDEAAGVGTAVFEGLDSVLSSGEGHMLAIGNPTTAAGEFGAMHKRADVARYTISAFDTPNFLATGITLDDVRDGTWARKMEGVRLPYPTLCTPAWVAEKYRQWGEEDPRFVSRVLGNFPAQDESCLHPEIWIDAAFDRWRDIQDSQDWSGSVNLGCDVARLGGDSTQIAEYVIGKGIRVIDEIAPMDTMATARSIVQRIQTTQERARVASVRIDMDGLGAGIYDRVRELMQGTSVPIIGVRNGASAIDKTRYANARSELHYGLREAMKPEGDAPIALPPSEDLKSELMAHRWALARGGQIAVSAKDDIKVTLGRSPDKADACAYAVGDVSGEREISFIPFTIM